MYCHHFATSDAKALHISDCEIPNCRAIWRDACFKTPIAVGRGIGQALREAGWRIALTAHLLAEIPKLNTTAVRVMINYGAAGSAAEF